MQVYMRSIINYFLFIIYFIIIIIIIINFYTPGSIDLHGYKLEARNKYPRWLEVRVFVRETEGVHNQSRVEALYEH